MADNVAALIRLMLVTDARLLGGRDLIELAMAAQRGGVTSVQLRLKDVGARDLVQLVRALIAAVRMPVLVNDRADVAIAAGAAGVHLGSDDVPIELARKAAPSGLVIGASVGSEAEAAAAGAADYWGIGPWRQSTTKQDAGRGLGPDGFRRLVRLAGSKPCIAIGGIAPADVAEVLATGGAGVAVVSGILGANDIEAAARSYRTRFPDLLAEPIE